MKEFLIILLISVLTVPLISGYGEPTQEEVSVSKECVLAGEYNPLKTCTAKFKNTLLKGNTVPIDNITSERGGLMVKYHTSNRWYYAESFTDLKCV